MYLLLSFGNMHFLSNSVMTAMTVKPLVYIYSRIYNCPKDLSECILYPSTHTFLTPFNGKQRKEIHIFSAIMFKMQIMTQVVQNNNISLPEFSNSKIFIRFHDFIQRQKTVIIIVFCLLVI